MRTRLEPFSFPRGAKPALVITIAIVAGLAVPGFSQQAGETVTRRPTVVTGRSKVATKYGIVAASQPLAARAGVQILERGGNAVDAAIATNAVMGLVEPHNNGIGGDLFAIYYEAKSGKLYGLNAGGWAPTGLTPALLRSKGLHAHAQQRHLLGHRARARSRAGRCCARGSARCRWPTCSRRRFSTRKTASPSPTSSPTPGTARQRKLAAGSERRGDVPARRPRAAGRRGLQEPAARRRRCG